MKPNQNQGKTNMEDGNTHYISNPADVYYGIGVRITRAMKADMDAKSSSKVVTKRGQVQLGAKKINSLDDNLSLRTSPRRKPTASKQDGQHDKQKPATSSAEQTKGKQSKQNEVQWSLKPSRSRAEETKDKISKEDKVHKKLKLSSTSVVQTKSKNSKQKEELKRSCSTAEEKTYKTPMQDKVQKKLKQSPPSYEPSARKMRVMQSLGLVAPLGSPFCKK